MRTYRRALIVPLKWPFLGRGLNECLSLIVRRSTWLREPFFPNELHELQKAHQRVKEAEELPSTLPGRLIESLNFRLSRGAPSLLSFFQRKQEEEEHEKGARERERALFSSRPLSLSSSRIGNAEGTAPRTETSLLNSLPIPEIAVWTTFGFTFPRKGTKDRFASSIPSRDNCVAHESRLRPIINGTCDQFNSDEDAITFT